MKMQTILSVSVAALGLLLTVKPVSAHHAFAAEFDAKKPIKLRRPGKNSSNQLVVAATFEDAVHETVHLNSHVRRQMI